MITVNLAVEDRLSEVVLRRLLNESSLTYEIGACFSRGGFGYLKTKIQGFNQAAKGIPFLVLTDLDQIECAPALIQSWLSVPKHPNLIFRVAVREVEAWLLASRTQFAQFLGISVQKIPQQIEELIDPKQTLIQLTRLSKRRSLKSAIIPADGSTAKIGPDYNGVLSQFVIENWDISEAMMYSDSLKRAFKAIQKLAVCE